MLNVVFLVRRHGETKMVYVCYTFLLRKWENARSMSGHENETSSGRHANTELRIRVI